MCFKRLITWAFWHYLRAGERKRITPLVFCCFGVTFGPWRSPHIVKTLPQPRPLFSSVLHAAHSDLFYRTLWPSGAQTDTNGANLRNVWTAAFWQQSPLFVTIPASRSHLHRDTRVKWPNNCFQYLACSTSIREFAHQLHAPSWWFIPRVWAVLGDINRNKRWLTGPTSNQNPRKAMVHMQCSQQGKILTLLLLFLTPLRMFIQTDQTRGSFFSSLLN